MALTIAFDKGKRSLALLWFIGGLLVFALLMFQSLLGKYGEDTKEAWAWFLPMVLPTLSLIAGIVAADATEPPQPDKTVSTFAFRLAFGLSGLYLLCLALVPLLQPLAGVAPIELMKKSNLWLSPLQGLSAALLGVFFVKGERGTAKP